MRMPCWLLALWCLSVWDIALGPGLFTWQARMNSFFPHGTFISARDWRRSSLHYKSSKLLPLCQQTRILEWSNAARFKMTITIQSRRKYIDLKLTQIGQKSCHLLQSSQRCCTIGKISAPRAFQVGEENVICDLFVFDGNLSTQKDLT